MVTLRPTEGHGTAVVLRTPTAPEVGGAVREWLERTAFRWRGGPRPRRRRAWARRVRRLAVELTVVSVIAIAASVALMWPLVQDVDGVLPGQGPDPFIEVWSMAWSGHGLLTAPEAVWHANAFHPAAHSLAFTDSLLGYGPVTWLFPPEQGGIVAFNLVMILTPALAALGGYLLARQLGAHPLGAAVAAAAVAFAPWRAGQLSHLHVLSTGPMLLALAMLARGHGLRMDGERRPPRPSWAFLGWLTAAWQVTIGFANGLPFAYLMAVLGVLVLLTVPVRMLLRRQPLPPLRLVLADVLGGLAFAATGLAMAYPYLQVQEADPDAVLGARGLDEVARYSPPPEGLLTPPSAVGTWSWLTDGATLLAGTNEVRVLPGAILLALAAAGVLFSTYRWWWRVTLTVAVAATGFLALGTNAWNGGEQGFVFLWEHVPGWAADRTPGRLVVFTTIALALLAAGFVSRVCGRRPRPDGDVVPARAGRRGLRVLRWALVPLLPAAMVAEGWHEVETMQVPPLPAAVAEAPAPMVVLPSIWTFDSVVMAWTAKRGFPALGNGMSGFTPSSLTTLRAELVGFPDQRSVTYLRAAGFRSVAVLRQDVGSVLWRDADRAPDPALGLRRLDLGDSVLFVLDD